MTTIVCDGTVVAADTGLTQNGARVGWKITKLRAQEYTTSESFGPHTPGARVIRTTRIFAFCGFAAMFNPWVDWWCGRRDPHNTPRQLGNDCDYMWIFEGGRLLEVNSGAPYPLPLGVPSAMGAGEKYAYGALALGHTAVEALTAASQCDPHTNAEFQVIELPEHLRITPQPYVKPWDIMGSRSPAPKSGPST